MFNARLARTAQRIWSRQGLVSTLLLPLSCLTGVIIRHKRARYRRHPERVWNSPVPVVIVGNIYVGGTGKTPVVIELVNALAQRGWTPGVVSRGYGVRIGTDARTGRGNLDPSRFGDEPALIASSTDAPVAVHPSRVNAAQTLLRVWPDVDVIVADDGLQHLALGRDAEIIVQDGRGIGNGRLLPAGPLREPASRLTQVDMVITNRSGGDTDPTRHATPGTQLVTERSHPTAGRRHDSAQSVTAMPLHTSMTLLAQDVTHLVSGECLSWRDWIGRYCSMRLGAAAAIGHPERFFHMLRSNGLQLQQTLPLPDHTAFDSSSFDALDTDIILITTKDAVKCAAMDDERLWAVRVTPHFPNMAWLDMLHDKLTAAAQRRAAGPA